jgi:diacylglycerol kinase family enzyme
VRLLTEAQPDDGVFDIAVLTPGSLRQWMALAWAVIRRRGHVPAMEAYRGARVEVRSNRPRPRKLNGDLIDPGHRLLVEMVLG